MFGFEMVSAMNSGAEAIDIAVKIARKWGYAVKGIKENEGLVLTCTGNYHGKTLSTISASDDSSIRIGKFYRLLCFTMYTDSHRVRALYSKCWPLLREQAGALQPHRGSGGGVRSRRSQNRSIHGRDHPGLWRVYHR